MSKTIDKLKTQMKQAADDEVVFAMTAYFQELIEHERGLMRVSVQPHIAATVIAAVTRIIVSGHWDDAAALEIHVRNVTALNAPLTKRAAALRSKA